MADRGAGPPTLSDGGLTLRPVAGRGDTFAIEVEGVGAVGTCSVVAYGAGGGLLDWSLETDQRGQGYASRALRVLVDFALTEEGQGGLGLRRVEAHVGTGNDSALRTATRAGLRREGVRRMAPDEADEGPDGFVVLARIVSDPPLTSPDAFRSLLNSFLPRKRAIAQLLVRDESPEPRVLLCQLTYKQDWDLPGGVVEVGESPQVAVGREIEEELALRLTPGPLLLTDWLPAWAGWDDALCLVFDGGAHPAEILGAVVRQTREIRAAEFATLAQVRERCADFTARRIEAALASLRGDGPAYTESGRG